MIKVMGMVAPRRVSFLKVSLAFTHLMNVNPRFRRSPQSLPSLRYGLPAHRPIHSSRLDNTGPNERRSQMDWATNSFQHRPTTIPNVAHSRSTSEHLGTASLGVPVRYDCEWDFRYMTLTAADVWGIPVNNRRHSVPTDPYQDIFQPQPVMPQGLLPMTAIQYQQPPTQPMSVNPGPLSTSVIPQTLGGPNSGPHSASPPHTPWYPPQPSPHPYPQLDSGFSPVSYHG